MLLLSVFFSYLLCCGVFAETNVVTTKAPERISSNVEEPVGYVPHAIFPYAETYPNPLGYENYLGPSGPQYPDVEEQTSIIPTTPVSINEIVWYFIVSE